MSSELFSLTASASTNLPSLVQEDPNQAHLAIVRLENVSEVYGSGETADPTLYDLNSTLEKDESRVIMEISGSSKSTAMSIIGCLARPASDSYYRENLRSLGLPYCSRGDRHLPRPQRERHYSCHHHPTSLMLP